MVLSFPFNSIIAEVSKFTVTTFLFGPRPVSKSTSPTSVATFSLSSGGTDLPDDPNHYGRALTARGRLSESGIDTQVKLRRQQVRQGGIN